MLNAQYKTVGIKQISHKFVCVLAMGWWKKYSWLNPFVNPLQILSCCEWSKYWHSSEGQKAHILSSMNQTCKSTTNTELLWVIHILAPLKPTDSLLLQHDPDLSIHYKYWVTVSDPLIHLRYSMTWTCQTITNTEFPSLINMCCMYNICLCTATFILHLHYV